MTSLPSNTPAGAELSAAQNALLLHGDWTLAHHARLEALALQLAPRLNASTTVDASTLGALDTAGAQLLHQLLGAERMHALAADGSPLPAERRALIRAVA